ncbi:MAG TPA: hypothetical protein EYP14_19075 [Planctomycetaceae bacterium]|nr:hypothetical protein [Planctomycetaceae bacterium]
MSEAAENRKELSGDAWAKGPSSFSTDTAWEEDLEERLAFLDLSEEDAERLRACSRRVAARLGEVIQKAFDHLMQFEEPRRLLQDTQAVERLKASQQQLFQLLFAAQWDQVYAERRRDVGRVHAERGVEPQYFLGAYSRIVQELLRVLSSDGDADDSDRFHCLLSFVKAAFLDIGLTLDEYFAQSTRDLRKALEMYWGANNELKQFAHLTSHDLKTPLATVANLCDEVLDEFGEQIPSEARQLIISARRTVFRMSSTVDELLSTSISRETVGIEDEISTMEVIQEAIERVRPELEKKDVQLIVPESFPTVAANKVQLREIMYNLLSNAVKYMDKPMGYIEIGIRATDSHCVISVRDNGPGIPREYLRRILAPFHRLSMHRNQAGSGLGLYFTKYLVEQQGGRIWVESEVGRGSVFHVELKRKPAPDSVGVPTASID